MKRLRSAGFASLDASRRRAAFSTTRVVRSAGADAADTELNALQLSVDKLDCFRGGGAGLAGGADYVEVRERTLISRLRNEVDDSSVVAHFKTALKENNGESVRRLYSEWVRQYEWNHAAPAVLLSVHSLNLVLRAYAAFEAEPRLARARVSKLRAILQKMEAAGTPRECQANGDTYAIFLCAVERADRVPKAGVNRPPLDVDHCVRAIERSKLTTTPDFFAAGFRILTRWQCETRSLWGYLKQQHPFLAAHAAFDLHAAATEAAVALADPSFLADVVRGMPTLTDFALLVKIVHVAALNGASPAEFAVVTGRLCQVVRGSRGPLLGPREVFSIGKHKFSVSPGILKDALAHALMRCEPPCVEAAGHLVSVFDNDDRATPTRLLLPVRGLALLAFLLRAGDEGEPEFLRQFATMDGLPHRKMPPALPEADWYAAIVQHFCTSRAAVNRLQQNITNVLQSIRDSKEAASQLGPARDILGMLGVSVLTRIGLMDEAFTLCDSYASVGPYLALLNAYECRSYDRTHERIFRTMITKGLKPSSECYDVCIILSCQGDNLDGALVWFQRMLEAHPRETPSANAYAHLLYSACVVGDGLLAVGIIDELLKHRISLAPEVLPACVQALEQIDWRGNAVASLKESIAAYEQALLSNRQGAVEESLKRRLQERTPAPPRR
ncbi:hypothetical protein DIPPA_00322 [Diplonema papillatum]|nr:hypothetical protein DIPPA_00322 [Diplonema papillatum]